MAEAAAGPRMRRVVRRCGGLTLVELMVAAALSLVVMGAVATLFGLFGRSVKQSQSTMHLSGLMRSAAWQLRQDLAGVTCPLVPWLAPEMNAGYFELIEGPARDSTYAIDGQGQPTDKLTADTDDILLFTTQSLADSFVGRYDGATIESPFAEVAWFCRPAATQPVPGTTLYDLHRRQLLVMNYLGRSNLPNNALPLTIDRAGCDISLRSGTIPGEGLVLLPNSLGDVTKRENRFMRSGYSFVTESGAVRSIPAQSFPFAFPLDPASGHAAPEAALDDAKRAWEDVVLTNVIAFDIRVFDPRASVPAAEDTAGRLPGDLGYQPAAAPQAGDGVGAYVDLAWGGGTPTVRTEDFPPTGSSSFQSAGVAVTDLPRRVALPSATYDTWSRHLEFNGIDDDGDGVIDEGVHGIDSDGDGWPEHAQHAETSPPYPLPLRGLEIRLRCYEPASRQVRQITIRHSFTR
jgi:hypothetical protein